MATAGMRIYNAAVLNKCITPQITGLCAPNVDTAGYLFLVLHTYYSDRFVLTTLSWAKFLAWVCGALEHLRYLEIAIFIPGNDPI